MAAGSTASPFTIAVAVDLPAGGDRRTSLAAAVRDAPAGTDLVVLPYLGPAPYLPAALDRAGYGFAERPPSVTVRMVADAAQERGIVAAVSFYEVVGEGVFYSTVALVAADGSTAGTYRQAHALNRPGQHEQFFFQPGNTGGNHVFAVGGARVGFLLGGDLWVPEATRLLALGGAEVLVAITAAPAADAGQSVALAQARAAENGRACVLASRADTGLAGRSMAFDPDGIPLAEAGPEAPWLIAELDLAAFAARRRSGDPLRLRRPRLYAPLAHGDEEAG